MKKFGCIKKETIGAVNEVTIDAIIEPRNLTSCLLFHVLAFQYHHQLTNLNLVAALRFY